MIVPAITPPALIEANLHSSFYYAVATAAYIRFGGHYIKHRSQDLSDALMQSIEDAGAQAFKALVKEWGG